MAFPFQLTCSPGLNLIECFGQTLKGHLAFELFPTLYVLKEAVVDELQTYSSSIVGFLSLLHAINAR